MARRLAGLLARAAGLSAHATQIPSSLKCLLAVVIHEPLIDNDRWHCRHFHVFRPLSMAICPANAFRQKSGIEKYVQRV